MSIVVHYRQNNYLSCSHRLVLLMIVISTLVVLTQQGKMTQALGLTSSGFSFSVAGDYAQTTHTTANLNSIATSGVGFHLAIGDFSYDPHVSAAAWSSYAKSHLPANFPFEILAGNEDTSETNTYIADLPNHLSSISGNYAKEYFFDYPASAPLARFILISPKTFYSYGQGSSHYTWLAQTIDSARAAHIHWVIVAMHEYCIDIGSDPCTIGTALENLLISKKIDVILQAHKHSYQVSKQLALNTTTCPSVSLNSYNANCVANASTSMTRGAGSVIVITGTGGASLSSINTANPETGYFRQWMGSNVSPTWGYSKFTISASQLSMHFVGVSGGFSDSFTIQG